MYLKIMQDRKKINWGFVRDKDRRTLYKQYRILL